MFDSYKMLINRVDMNNKRTRAPELFYLLAPSDDNKVRIKIFDATLFITHVELKPLLVLAHANALAMKHKAHYPVTHSQIKTLTAIYGVQDVSIENAFPGTVPERILIAFVKNTPFVGSARTNQFHFHHCDMTNLVFFVNGVRNLSNQSKWIAIHPLVLPWLTKYYFQVRVSITTTVFT